MSYIKIVPANKDKSGPQLCNGTTVYDQNGNEIKGITSITLRAECNDIWKAVIECNAYIDDEIMAKIGANKCKLCGNEPGFLDPVSGCYQIACNDCGIGVTTLSESQTLEVWNNLNSNFSRGT